LRCVEDLEVETDNEDQGFGVEIVRRACVEPIRKLSENCDEKADIIVYELTVQMADSFHMGYNFATGKYVDMYKDGVIDPAKVTRCALQNAVSAASTLLTTSHAIIEV